MKKLIYSKEDLDLILCLETEKYEDKINNLQSKIDKVIELCETEKKYTYDNVRRDANTGKLIYGNKIELDVVNKSKILDILKEEQPKETKELFEGTMNQLNDLSIFKEDK